MTEHETKELEFKKDLKALLEKHDAYLTTENQATGWDAEDYVLLAELGTQTVNLGSSCDSEDL